MSSATTAGAVRVSRLGSPWQGGSHLLEDVAAGRDVVAQEVNVTPGTFIGIVAAETSRLQPLRRSRASACRKFDTMAEIRVELGYTGTVGIGLGNRDAGLVR
jgi:hypothetical protein